MNEILERIKKAYRLETDAEVADFLDIKPSTLSMQKNRGRLDLKRIIKKCSDLNKNWLLDGVGEIRWNSERSISIPIYKTLEASGDKLDLDSSKKVGNLQADFAENLDNDLLGGKLIGYLAKEDVATPAINKNDVAIISLEKEPADNSIGLLYSGHKIVLRRVESLDGQYVVQNDGDKQRVKKIGANGELKCMGNVISVLRNL